MPGIHSAEVNVQCNFRLIYILKQHIFVTDFLSSCTVPFLRPQLYYIAMEFILLCYCYVLVALLWYCLWIRLWYLSFVLWCRSSTDWSTRTNRKAKDRIMSLEWVIRSRSSFAGAICMKMPSRNYHQKTVRRLSDNDLYFIIQYELSVIRGVHPPKANDAYSPYFRKIFKIPPYFRWIYVFWLNSCFFCFTPILATMYLRLMLYTYWTPLSVIW